MTAALGELWRFRAVLGILVRRDLAVKYQQSVLGYVWSLLEPLGMAGAYWFVFGVLYRTRVTPGGGPPYILYLVSGLFAWQWAQSAMSEATGALTSQAQLITTMRVPRTLFPFGRVVARFAEYLAGLPILVLLAVVYHAPVGLSVLALPLALALELVLLTGLSLLLASANVMLRDVERVLRVALRVMFYCAPVIYPLERVLNSSIPLWVKRAYQANPFVGILQLHHAVWYPREFPSWHVLAVTATGCLLVLGLGVWVFRRLEPAVLKEL